MFEFKVSDYKKVNARKSKTNIKYLRFHKEKYPLTYSLIEQYNRSLNIEAIFEAFVKSEVLPKLK